VCQDEAVENRFVKRSAAFLSLLLISHVFPGEPLPEEDFAGHLRLVVPPAIPVLSELEANLYFDTLFLALNPADYHLDVTCSKGAQQSHRWTWTPNDEEAGEYPIKIEVRDEKNRVTARASSILSVKARALSPIPAEAVTLLMVGDSLTAASIYSRQVLSLAQEDGLPLTLVGTRGPGAEEGTLPTTPNRHEGYGGWTAERFATHFTGVARGGPYRQCGSPFLYKDKPEDGEEVPRLDFERYCEEFNGGSAPDYVTILLGCNDTFRETDETIEDSIEKMFRHYETLVSMFRRSGSGTRIGAILPMPPAATQEAFGKNYGSGQTRWQYRRNQHRVVERMIESFGGREAENLFLVPAYLNLDPVHGFPSTDVPAHARSAAIENRQSNGVHPSAEGYHQLGDAIYAWLRSFESLKP